MVKGWKKQNHVSSYLPQTSIGYCTNATAHTGGFVGGMGVFLCGECLFLGVLSVSFNLTHLLGRYRDHTNEYTTPSMSA